MAGRTVSAYVDEDVVRRVEDAARLEARPVSQVASAALAFYARLPGEARRALRVIEALGGSAALDQLARVVARQIVDAEYDVAERRAAEAIPAAALRAAGLADRSAGLDDDLLAAALQLTTHAERPLPVPAGVDATPARVRRQPRGRRPAAG